MLKPLKIKRAGLGHCQCEMIRRKNQKILIFQKAINLKAKAKGHHEKDKPQTDPNKCPNLITYEGL